MSENTSHIIKRILKATGWILLVLLLLMGSLRLLMMTDWATNFAKDKAVSIANESLNGTLSIDRMEGDLWKELSITNLNLVQEDTLFHADSLYVNYDILSLLGGSFNINTLNLSRFNSYIRETSGKQFNVQEIVKTDTTAPQSESSFGLSIDELLLSDGAVRVYSPSYLPDSTLKVQKLTARASFGLGDEISASLQSLEFDLKEGRLPEPIRINASASYENNRISLQQLALESSRSLLKASGHTNLTDSTIQANATTQPLALADLKPYFNNEDLPDDSFNITLKVNGNPDSLNLNLDARSDGFDTLTVISNISFRDSLTIRKAGISARNINLAYFTNDSLDATIGEIRASAEGKFRPDSIQLADLTWGFTFYDIRYQDYVVDQFFGSGTLIEENILGYLQAKSGEERIVMHPEIKSVFSDTAAWNSRLVIHNIDAGWWARNPDLKSDISLSGEISGNGFQLNARPWKYEFNTFKSTIPRRGGKPVIQDTITVNGQQTILSYTELQTIRDTVFIAGQKFSEFKISGAVNQDSLTSRGFVQLIESRISFDTRLENFTTEKPSYSYHVSTSEFDLREISGLEAFPSSLNLSVTGEGTSFDPEQMVLQTRIDADSSIVNGALVRNLDLNASLENGIFRIPEGLLESQIIAGEFSARKNIMDRTDPENELNLNMEIKNLQPLAPLAGTEILYAKGRIQGLISEQDTSRLQFNGNVDLRDVNYDSLFIAESVYGQVMIGIDAITDFKLNVDIGAPVISGITLQDMEFRTEGFANTDSLQGDFNLLLNSEQAGQVSQSGQYEFNRSNLSTHLTWNAFEFITPARTLTLQQPFHFSFEDQAIQTDTLVLSSQDSSFLKLAVPYADSLTQEGWIQGQNFNFGVIQEILFAERFVDGILEGEIQATRDNTDLRANGSFHIRNLEFMETSLDLLDLDFDIRQERLTAKSRIQIDGEDKITGDMDVPFKLGDPTTFDDQFFEEPVQGKLNIRPLDISRFENILRHFEVEETRGIITFDGSLDGVAGEPNMNGRLSLREPTLSGINIDSASASFNYDHQNTSLKSSAEIHARGQLAAAITADFPISVDFRTFEVNMPGETDTLLVDLKTDDFNISVFNDFLNKEYMSNLRGTLNADLQIKGTKENMVPDGFLRLGEGRLSVPVAGITLEDIRSDLEFTESGLTLKTLRAGSGNGDIRANGSIQLNGLQPANLDITARARQFRLANTSQYRLNINLDGKLTGKPTTPKASGKITINRGFVQLQDFGEKSVEDVQLEGEDEINFSPYDSLALEMQVVITDDFYVRNSRYLDMEVELNGDLDAVKDSGEDMQLFGSLNGVDGYARPLGKEFTLEEASFTFSGPIENPNLLIRTSYVPPSPQNQGQPITIFYIVEGTAQEPEFRFESEPPMEQQDIVCYTIFGKPCYSLESWQQVVSSGSGGTSPQGLLVDVLLDEVEQLATRELGIDVVEIDNSGSDTGTSIKTGWYINRRTFFAIVNQITDSTPQVLFILEYMLKQNLDLIITQGGDNREGIDLRWQFDY